MIKRRLWEFGAMLALSVNYASAWIAALIWNWPNADSELTVHIVIMLAISLLFGALIVDMKRTIFYTIGAVAVGFVIATVIVAMPALIAEGPGGIEASFTVALSSISKLFVVSITFLIVGAFVGCFIGDAVTGIERD